MSVHSTSLGVLQKRQGTMTEQKGQRLHGNKYPRLECLDRSVSKATELETDLIPEEVELAETNSNSQSIYKRGKRKRRKL